MERYELVCFSLRPGLSEDQARTLAARILPGVSRVAPGHRLGVLPLERARSAQRDLTRAGIVCNYRPATDTPDWRLADEERILHCPHCGSTATVPRQRRNYRCRHCHHAVLRHGREVPPPSRQPVPRPAATVGSGAITALLVLALAILLAGPVQPAALTRPVRAVWHQAVTPVAREFHFLTQVMARHRQHAGTPAIPATVAATRPAPPVTAPATAGDPDPTPQGGATPPAASGSDPGPVASLPGLPRDVRGARSLNQLHQALVQQLDDTSRHPLPPLPQTTGLPPAPIRLPQATVPTARLQAAVAVLDDHLRRTAPFLRRLYAHELDTLTQLRRLERTLAGPARRPVPARTARDLPPPETTATRSGPEPAAPAFCPAVQTPSYCPVSG